MKWLKWLFGLILLGAILVVGGVVGLYLSLKPDLPDVSTLKTIQLQTPMRVYSADGKLISQFGEKRRIPLEIDEIPEQMLQAFLATEDNRFYQHPGIDPIGMVRAAYVVFSTGEMSQGASTITQQVARNFFLTREKTYIRKIKEIFLAWHIEQLLTKDEILALYLNKIPLGYRSFGVGAAAQVYYGKTVDELTLAQIAVIAGLPQAPSVLNPIHSPERAKARRAVVLGRMLAEGYITRAEYDEAVNAPITGRYHGAEIDLYAPFIAEMVRNQLVAQYGEERAYSDGLSVHTTIDSKMQLAAQQSLRNNLYGYDMRHGYRGPVKTVWEADQAVPEETELFNQLDQLTHYGAFRPAVVTAVNGQDFSVLIKGGEKADIGFYGYKWARPFINDKRQGTPPKQASDVVKAGELIWVRRDETGAWMLTQLPDANAGFVALEPNTGAVKALSGGFNYDFSKFNRVTMAKRQVGSTIKPFVYSAAFEQGMTLGTLLNDAPINRWDSSQGVAWRPKNSPAVYNGPTRLRLGLAQSKNVMSVRLIREVGIEETIEHMTKFGFKAGDLPANETLSLGSAGLTPLEMATAYSVFANGGFNVTPYFISRIEDGYGNLVMETLPPELCTECVVPALNIKPEDEEGAEGETTFEPEPIKEPELNETVEDELVQTEPVELDENQPLIIQQEAPRVLSGENAFLVQSALKSAIWGGGSWNHQTGWNGTGWRAARMLKRHDISGKTGTTNSSKDAWFAGFTPELVGISWVGFDDHRRELGTSVFNPNLGKDQITGGEFGGRTALPAWISFMQVALDGVPEVNTPVPEGLVEVRIDRESGLLTRENDHTSRFEYFVKGTEPTEFITEQQAESNLFDDSSSEDDLF